MNSGMALKEFCTITNIGSEIFMRLRGEKTLGSGGKIKKNYLSMEFRMIDERNIKWLSLDDIKKYFIFNFCRSRYTNPTTIQTIKEAENLIFKNGNLINKTIEYLLKHDLKSGFISKIDDLNLYIELLRKKSSINIPINSKDIFNLEASLEFTSFINDSIESQKNNSIKKEKNLTVLETNITTLKSKILEKEIIKKFLLNKLEYNSHLTYNRIIYSPELREEVQNWNLENPNEKAVIKITEHAILRYLERVKGIDMESIKKEMVPDELKEKALKNGNYEINKLKYIVQGKQIITVVHKKAVKKIFNLDNISNDKKYNSYQLRKGAPSKYLNLYKQKIFLKVR